MRLGYWVDTMMLNCTDEIMLAVIKTPQMIKSLGGDIIPLVLSPSLFILTQEVKEPRQCLKSVGNVGFRVMDSLICAVIGLGWLEVGQNMD